MGSFARYVIACVALLVAAFVLEGGLPRLTRAAMARARSCSGLLGVFAYNLFFMGALERLPASRAALIIALNPVITIAISSLVLKERLSARRWLGVAIALLGVWIVISHGDVASIASAGVGAGRAVHVRARSPRGRCTPSSAARCSAGLSPLAATNYAALWGTLMLGVRGRAAFRRRCVPRSSTGRMIVALLYLGVCGTALAFVWYYMSVKKLGASVTSIFNNLVPVFGVAISVLVLGEPLLPSMLIGGAIAIAGVMMVSRRLTSSRTRR